MKILDLNRNLSGMIQNTTELFNILIGFILLVIATNISVPLKPVPITLQTMSVLYIALKFNYSSALNVIKTYIIIGALGLPVFSGINGGLAYMSGPTGGYILGFYLAVHVVNYAKSIPIKSGFIKNNLMLAFGSFVIMLSGFSWLALLTDASFAFNNGVMPFILPEIYKIVTLSLICAIK